MPTMRIYASDCVSLPVQADRRTGGLTWNTNAAKRLDSVTLESVYSFEYDGYYVYPPVHACTGAILTFNLGAVPALAGVKVTAISGPWVYLTGRNVSLRISTSRPYSYGCDTRLPFLRWCEGTPSDPVGKAKLRAFYNLRTGYVSAPHLTGDLFLFHAVVGMEAYPETGEYCSGRASITFEGHSQTHRPYIDITYDAPEIEIIGASPQAGFVNEHVQNRFAWALGSPERDTVGTPVQSSAYFQWRTAGSSTAAMHGITGKDTFLDLPAETLSNGSIEWRVSAVSSFGKQSPYSPWYQLSTLDEAPDAPDALTPGSGIRDGSRPILFSWRHNAPLSTPPSAFEIQTDTGSGFTALSGKVTGTGTQYSLPAGRLPSGSVRWRVRTYSSDGAPSPWSEPARFTVRAAPAAPAVRSVETGTPRPIVQWVSSGQHAVQVRVEKDGETVWDSGFIPTLETRMRVDDFLPDGRYRFLVRIENEFGLWSEWSALEGLIATRQRLAVTLRGREVQNGVRLDFDVEVLS